METEMLFSNVSDDFIFSGDFGVNSSFFLKLSTLNSLIQIFQIP